jgi:hypothetical protein
MLGCHEGGGPFRKIQPTVGVRPNAANRTPSPLDCCNIPHLALRFQLCCQEFIRPGDGAAMDAAGCYGAAIEFVDNRAQAD